MDTKDNNVKGGDLNNIGKLAESKDVDTNIEVKPTRSRVDKNVIDYVMTSIFEFSKRWGLTVREASNYLNRFKGLDFLIKFYDVEHTLSFNDCVDDLTIICQNNGGEIR